MSAVNAATRRRGHKEQSARVVTLTDEEERSRPFASALGQLMMTQRNSQAAAKQVVGDKAYPQQGVLTPGGSFSCTLHCSTGLTGDYEDVLHVQVNLVTIMHEFYRHDRCLHLC